MEQAKTVGTPTMGGREWAMLLTLAVLWGGSFFFNGVAVRELPSFTLVWLRVALAAATLLMVLRLLGQRMPTAGRVWAAFFGMGLLNNVVPFVLILGTTPHCQRPRLNPECHHTAVHGPGRAPAHAG